MCSLLSRRRGQQDYDAEIAEEAKPSIPCRSQFSQKETLRFPLTCGTRCSKLTNLESSRSYLVTRPQRKVALQASSPVQSLKLVQSTWFSQPLWIPAASESADKARRSRQKQRA